MSLNGNAEASTNARSSDKDFSNTIVRYIKYLKLTSVGTNSVNSMCLAL